MKKSMLFTVMFLLAGTISLMAQDIPAKTVETENPSPAIEQFTLAQLLANYGYDNNDPVSLVMAARVMKGWSYTTLEADDVTIANAEVKAPDGTILDVDKLLEDAAVMAGEKEHVLAMITEVKNTGARGAKDGPQVGVGVLEGLGSIYYEVKFVGDEFAEVAVEGDGEADIDLYVFDKDENLIGADESGSASCYVSWYPPKTEKHYILLINRGENTTFYAIATN
jgi:hypothetical protein